MRIEIGPRDVSNGSVVVSRRDIPGKQGKVFGISMEPSTLVAYVKGKLEEVQSSLLERAKSFRDRYIDIQLYMCLRVFLIFLYFHNRISYAKSLTCVLLFFSFLSDCSNTIHNICILVFWSLTSSDCKMFL